jgi:glycosyltransferase involved in cell wall biosynthesis
MKVCLVSHSSAMGGGERSLLETIHVLRHRGVDCVVLMPRDGPLGEALTRAKIPWTSLPYRWWVGPENGPRWRRAARVAWDLFWCLPAYLRTRRWAPDLYYTNTLTVPLGAWTAALAGKPHVWHIREMGHDHNRMVFDLGENIALRVMDRLSALILTNSHCVARRFREAFAARKVAVVYQAVTPDRRDNGVPAPAEGSFRCVAVGAISRAKHQEEAIEAVAVLRGEGHAVELAIIGRGDAAFELELRARVAELGLDEAVSFLGELPTAWHWIESADAVVQCSRHEAFGRVTVEGMLAGRPVVGARSAGTAELIEDRRNGFLYEPGDVAGLASILRELIERPETGAGVAARAREWAASRFGEQRYGDELAGQLRRVVESG